ncbi:PQQ-dependent sugar dehydrogenase [Pleionea sediminis]|uniref:PQQ-dependent sugar dehydrogenase n=1 Tax=Pleionea sediminis TaxID=2569479 RepID=UPI00118610BD|nr:PQQ-dependent sugar dehydrogenase [Pleionea sediminis]
MVIVRWMFICSLATLTLIGCGGSSGGGNSQQDSEAPVITLLGQNPVQLFIHSEYQEAGATAQDNIDGNVSVTISGAVDSSVAGNYTLTYTATDNAGNTASAEREVEVLGERLSNLSCLPPEPVSTDPGDVSFEPSFPSLPFMGAPLAMVQPLSDSSFWLAALRDGRIVRFDNSPTVDSFDLVLDITSRVTTQLEMGLTGLAIHPDYPTSNYVYIVYNDGQNSGRSTISRFTINTSNQTIDANSELRLITLPQPANNHNGGDIAFGPDGFLYASFGDGGWDATESQDLSTLHGTIIRISVTESGYDIPESNPLNTGQEVCDSGSSQAGNCPEIYAYGFRNPWRFSFDALTGELWVADVGESTFEEVDRVTAGGNYGWPIMEGDQCFDGGDCNPDDFELPVTQYPRSVGVSTVGGYVYRGDDSPSLAGLYLWGDTFSSQFLSVSANAPEGSDYTLTFNSQRIIAGMAQGIDGEVYLLNLQGDAGDEVFKITATGGATVTEMPENLSDVGCFDTVEKSYTQGVMNYQIQSILWSDGASKDRAFAIPDDETIEITEEGDFIFPENSILIKHFLNNNSYLETRLLVNLPGGWQGFSYEWNDEQTEAVLLTEGKTKDVGDFIHTFPSQAECAVCHTQAANHSLGLEVTQLNRVGPVATNNQLDLLSDIGFLSSLIDSELEDSLVALSDINSTVEQRARSYLHSNCSNCHRPGAQGSFIDLRYSTTLQDTNLCDVAPTAGDLGVDNARRLAPGDAARSIVLLRMQALDGNRMPPLASLSVDEEATAVIEQWINELSSCIE